MELNKSNIKKILGIIVFTVVFFTAFQHFSIVAAIITKVLDIIAPVIIGLCIAFILNVPMQALEKNVFKFMANSKRTKIRKLLRPVSLISTIILTVGFVALLLLIIIPQLKDAIVLLISKFPEYVTRFIEFAEPKLKSLGVDFDLKFLHPEKMDISKIQGMVAKVFSVKDGNEIFNTTMGVTTSVISGVVNFALGFVLAVYVLAQKEKIIAFSGRLAKAVLPNKVYENILHISTVAENSFSSFITGQFTDATLLATLCFIGMSIFRFPNAAVVAVTIGVTALVPVIGPFIGEAISFVIIFIESPIKALFFLVFIFILQAIDNNFIYPKIVGKSVGLPGFLVLIAVIIGGNIGGMLGILLGVPIVSAIYVLVLDALNKKEQEEKNRITEETESNIQKGE